MEPNCYKVVFWSATGKYQSVASGSEASVEYEVGKPTCPKEGYGPLFAFSNLPDAEQFADTMFVATIFSAYGEGQTKHPSVRGPVPPKGTIFYKKITILKEIT